MRTIKMYIYYCALAVFFVATLTVGCAKTKNHLKPVVKTNFLLDTLVKITAYGPDASEAIDDAFVEISKIQEKMTVNAMTSEVIEVNKYAGISSVEVDEDTFNVIERGVYYSELSDGMFDITVGPLVKLWGIGTDDARVPSRGEVESVKALVGFQDVILDEKNMGVFLKRESMGLDVGGIAKGYAADVVKDVMMKRGVASAAIDLGGNMLVIGTKPDGSPWKIGLQDPFTTRGNVFATVEVVDKTIVTSGVYERFFESDGKRYHHILDPKTGFPVENGLVSVTIITDRSIDADALSTAVFALGLEAGMQLVESIPEVSAVFVTEDKKVHMTSGVPKYDLVIVDDEFEI